MHRIEVGRYIAFNEPEVAMIADGVQACILDRIHRPTVGAESERALTKISFVDGLQNHAQRFLNNPISN